MKAVVSEEFGLPNVLKLKEIPKPVPKENEILIKVYATPVSYGDIMARDFKNFPRNKFNMPFLFWVMSRVAFGLNKPKINILGSEFSGKIMATGKKVKKFKVGDDVFGYLGQKFGGYAEYISLPEESIVCVKPENMTYEEACCVSYGAMIANNLLKKVSLRQGQKVIVNGASGGIGSAAVQLLKNHYKVEVTGVCSGSKMEYVKSLGADHVVDYTKEDFTKNGKSYDLIFDILGKISFSKCRKSLNRNGVLLLASFKAKHLLQMVWTSIFKPAGRKTICALSPENREDLFLVKEFVESGKIKSTIDKRYPVEKIVEAHTYVEKGLKNGNVVINI